MNPQVVGTDLLWVQMASFGSFNQLSYDQKQQVVETRHLNPQMASTTICNYVAQLVRVALELLKPGSFQGSLHNCESCVHNFLLS